MMWDFHPHGFCTLKCPDTSPSEKNDVWSTTFVVFCGKNGFLFIGWHVSGASMEMGAWKISFTKAKWTKYSLKWRDQVEHMVLGPKG